MYLGRAHIRLTGTSDELVWVSTNLVVIIVLNKVILCSFRTRHKMGRGGGGNYGVYEPYQRACS